VEVEWTETALGDMAALDKGIARRVKQSVERFAETGAGTASNGYMVSTRQSSASASATTALSSSSTTKPCASSALEIGKKLIGKSYLCSRNASMQRDDYKAILTEIPSCPLGSSRSASHWGRNSTQQCRHCR